jgi:hypothetical protein
MAPAVDLIPIASVPSHIHVSTLPFRHKWLIDLLGIFYGGYVSLVAI